MNSVRAFRGATQLSADTKEDMSSAVVELLKEMLSVNSLGHEDLISILFTATPDIQSDFPAAGVREFGLVDLPLICAQELDIKGALPRTIRLLVHANSSLSRAQISHVYLRGAAILRPDLAKNWKDVQK